MSGPLRDYQSEQIEQLRDALRKHQAVLLQGVTGSGKGYVAGYIFAKCKAAHKKVMFMVHGLNVLDTFCEELEGDEDTDGWIEKDEYTRFQAGHEYNRHKPAIVASADTIARRYFSANPKHDPDELEVPAFIIADECRMLKTPTYVKMFQWYKSQGSKIIGLDATPDAKALGNIYDHMIHGRPTQWFIDREHLVPITHYAPNAADADFIDAVREIRSAGGDFVQKEVAKFTEARTVLVGDIVTQYERISMAEYGEHRRFVVACANKAHARSVQSAFIESGHSVEYIDGDTPADERHAIKRRMESGDVLGIISVEVMIYGANWKFLEIAILARLTKKTSVMLQFGGRILRTYPGKEQAVFIDMGTALRDCGYINDIYNWTLDHDAPVNNSRKDRDQELEKKELDITCSGCGHVYKNAGICPKCGTHNAISYGEPNVVYYNKELRKMDQERERQRQKNAEQLEWLGKLKWYISCSDKHPTPSQKITAFNRLLRKKYKYMMTADQIAQVQPIEDLDGVISRYEHSRRIAYHNRKR